MGNPRSFTTKHNAVNDRLRAFLKAKGCTTRAKRDRARELAAAFPNSLPAAARAGKGQG